MHRGNHFLRFNIKSSRFNIQLGSRAQIFKVLGFEVILLTFLA